VRHRPGPAGALLQATWPSCLPGALAGGGFGPRGVVRGVRRYVQRNNAVTHRCLKLRPPILGQLQRSRVGGTPWTDGTNQPARRSIRGASSISCSTILLI